MEFNLNTIKINNKVEIKVLDLIWFIFIPIINVNYYISSITGCGNRLCEDASIPVSCISADRGTGALFQ